MKSGTTLITEERGEHFDKHHWNDDENTIEELVSAALFAITLDINDYPPRWNGWWYNKMLGKSLKERLIISGAMCAATIDKIQKTEQ